MRVQAIANMWCMWRRRAVEPTFRKKSLARFFSRRREIFTEDPRVGASMTRDAVDRMVASPTRSRTMIDACIPACHPRSVVTEEPGRFADHVYRQRAALRVFALRLTRNRADADDLVQETIVQALSRQNSLVAEDKLAGWMMTIMHNLFIDHVRKRKRERRAMSHYRDGHDVYVPREADAPPRWSMVSNDQVMAAIRRLSPKLREVYLYKVEGLSYQEISARLGVSTNTVGTRLMRARHALKEFLSSESGGAS